MRVLSALAWSLLAVGSAHAKEAATAGERFVEAVEGEVEAIAESVSDKGDADDLEWVKARLGAMVAVDQYLRGIYGTPDYAAVPAGERASVNVALSSLTVRYDRAHSKTVKRMLKDHDWFRISVFGPHADADGWMLVQHADHDRKFQEAVLETLGELVSIRETRPVHFAYLSDRLAVAKGAGQLFGTQGHCTGPGEWAPSKIQDPDHVDDRRIPYEMSPMAEYVVETSRMCQ